MKKISILCIAVACIMSGASAQSITITKSNMAVAGDEYIYSTTNDNVDATVTGANHTWDFSRLSPASQDTMKFASPQNVNLAYALIFFGDIAVQQPNSAIKDFYGFFKLGNSGYIQEGAGFTIPMLGLPLPLKYTRPDIVYRFPLSYGNAKDSCIFKLDTTIQNIPIAIHGKRVNTIDGYGTIITPFNTYSCIRIKSVVTEYDTLGFIPLNNSRIEYKWLSIAEKTPVLQIIESATLGTSVLYRDMHRDIVNPNAPQISFAASSTTVQVGDTVRFTNSTTPPVAQWNWAISPSTFSWVNSQASTKAPEIVFNAEGQYDVSLSANTPFGSSSLSRPKYITVLKKAGIALNSQPDVNGLLQVYPNPSCGDITIFSPVFEDGKMLIWELMDMTGRKIVTGADHSSGGTARLRLGSCRPGIYILQIEGNRPLIQKVWINK